MQNRDPNIVTSSYSRRVTRDGITVEVGIHRLETEPGWSLEVVNAAGTSTVWDDLFETDDAANAPLLYWPCWLGPALPYA